MTGDNGYRTGFIALIGRPNVGKSTLMNRLIGYKVAITSNKPQTTRGRIRTVVTDERSQMIFLDSPGLHEAKNRLGERMMRVARDVRSDADVILWLLDGKRGIGDEERQIAGELSRLKQPVIIVFNKADAAVAEKLEESKGIAEKEFGFAECVEVSALKGGNIDELKEMIVERLPYGPPLYDEDTLTDMPERDIVAEIIREKALRLLSDEVPHGIAVSTQSMRQRNKKDGSGIVDIHADIICERETHKGIVIGKGGRMLKEIGKAAREDIERLLETPVNLQLFVKVRKDWRDDVAQLKSLGLWTD